MAKLDEELDSLFQLPLTNFIAARKALAAQLKKSGHAAEAESVKSLAKPPVSAWTVNQLYWRHREAFDELLASGQRFRKAQTSGKVALMRDALEERREALADLSELATGLLTEAGSNPSLDMIRRITSTLEAVSAHASLPDGVTLGRLTKDIDAPGFESLAGFTASAGVSPTRTSGSAGVSPAKTTASADVSPARITGSAGVPPAKTTGSAGVSPAKSSIQSARHEEQTTKRQAQLAAAKVSLQQAKKSLTEARAKAQSLESQQKKAEARAKEAEKQKREAEKESRAAEERLQKAISTAEDASRRARTVSDEVEEAKIALAAAQRTVESATKELESLFRSTKN